MKKLLHLIVFFILLIAGTASAQQNVNLLVNPGCDDGATTGWDVTSMIDDGWAVEATGGTDGTPCWVSSYSNTTKSQVVDLIALGYTPSYLDQEPIILYAESYKGFYGGSSMSDEYQLNIYLMDDNNVVLYTYQSGILICDSTWQSLKGVIRSYGTGVRKIMYEHIGNCANYWAGNYGAMIDDSYLSIGNNIYYSSGKTHSLAGWTIDANGGDGWMVDPNGYYITSNATDTKSQIIDLVAQGYTPIDLDMQPVITFGEFAKGTQPDYADYYNQTVTLLDASSNVLATSTQTPTLTDQWQWVSGSFSGYGTGLRYIKYEHSGRDVEGLAGHSGSMMDYILLEIGGATTGIDSRDNESFNFAISPNPSNGSFTLSLKNLRNNAPVKLTISDIEGRIVYAEQIENNLNQLSTSTYMLNQVLSKGVYILSLADQTSVQSTKLLIQ
ncbi:MAG: T9SS type A sorting domain-containing protein [Bacteroidetes bacterium]|nr:T9SS type A sorting domain-containing protein [Bacteroidota bacterium]MBL0139212.1 T9SS type A sorting domain-containing protein [Bacteroidota bacterium]